MERARKKEALEKLFVSKIERIRTARKPDVAMEFVIVLIYKKGFVLCLPL